MTIPYSFPDIDSMPDIPALPIPDYGELSASFRAALLDPANEIYRLNQNGHPNFGAYIGSPSNEFVTLGILILGEWLAGRDTEWISRAFRGFFSEEHGIFLNSPNSHRTEYWYLFYVNSLAGAVAKHVFDGGSSNNVGGGSGVGSGISAEMDMVRRSARTMQKMAEFVSYSFNAQGFDFASFAPWTRKDIYRQPDSIAGYAYNMLFAALNCRAPELLEQSKKAVALYTGFNANPWYEIPNGSAGLYAAAWLNAHGSPQDVKKAAAWIFDHDAGPLQTGMWGNETIDGLIMGWRGDTRQYALDAAYSMESLMPLQFMLPAAKYCPELCWPVAKFARNLLSSFQLFYAKGKDTLHETKPDLCPAIPYEKLERVRDGHSPAACGDFHGHRSVYGAGYMPWVDAIARKTGENRAPAFDLSLTDWPAAKRYPLFLLCNPYDYPIKAAFTPAPSWRLLAPDLYPSGSLSATLWDLGSARQTGIATGSVSYDLAPQECLRLALLPRNAAPQATTTAAATAPQPRTEGRMVTYNGAEIGII